MCLPLNSLFNTGGIKMLFKLSNVAREDEFSPAKYEIANSSLGQPLNRNMTFCVFDLQLPGSDLALFSRVLLMGELKSGFSHWKSCTVLVKAQDIHLAAAGALLSLVDSSPSWELCSTRLPCKSWAKDSVNLLHTRVSNSSKTVTVNSLNSCLSNWCKSDLELKNLYPHRRLDRFRLP